MGAAGPALEPGTLHSASSPDLPAQREGSEEGRHGQSRPGPARGLQRPRPILSTLWPSDSASQGSRSLGTWRGPGAAHVLRAAPSAQKQQRLKAHRGGLLPLGTWLAHTVPCEEAWLQDSAPASGLPGLARENQPHGILSPVPTPSTPWPPTLALPEDRTQDAGGQGTAVGHRPCCMQGQRPRPVRGDKAELARHQHGGGARSEYTRADVTAPVIPRGAGRACRRRRSTKPCGSPPHPPSSRSRPPRG